MPLITWWRSCDGDLHVQRSTQGRQPSVATGTGRAAPLPPCAAVEVVRTSCWARRGGAGRSGHAVAKLALESNASSTRPDLPPVRKSLTAAVGTG